jgi:hypothetical protein
MHSWKNESAQVVTPAPSQCHRVRRERNLGSYNYFPALKSDRRPKPKSRQPLFMHHEYFGDQNGLPVRREEHEPSLPCQEE